LGPPGAPGGGFGGRSLDDIKRSLGSTDEEWKVIRPKLEKTLAARQVLAIPTPVGGPGPGGSGGANAVAQAVAEVRAVLDDPKHTKAELQEKVAAVRKARQKACADLDSAQKDLLLMLTPEQKAILVGLGYLD
jgi:hypothetical protein